MSADETLLTEVARGDTGSEIRKMFALAESYEGDLTRLEVGEPDFDTPEFVTDSAAESARDGATHYTPMAGIPPLREGIAEKMRRENAVEVEAEDIVVTNGGTEALLLALQAVVGDGQQVVIPTPAWPTYTIQTNLVGGEAITVPMDPDERFALDADRVCAEITDETAAVLLCSPSNPTGTIYEPDAVRQVAETAHAHDAVVIADEVYERLTFQGSREGIAGMVEHPESVVTINSFSKGYAMTGWRIGWLASESTISEGARRLHAGTTLSPSSVAQQAGLAALEGPQDQFEEMIETYQSRCNHVADRLSELPGIEAERPDGSFYLFVDIRGLGVDSATAAEELLTEHGVATVPGIGFGSSGEGHLRVSCAASRDDLDAGVAKIEDYVNSL
ncbi:pyridoxal phosphate-dependent aminotransferase [Halorussus lipolyticus]|uniref:pyridoxal phosphate-dependent aminotransferase n=1 Tax=Halorussus lipolyticus TaxID=3034024 RepID=UPI0023E89F59|nr:pyridoxal phosphate-dependent aminotransferase [Halorussus sp. DT80]